MKYRKTALVDALQWTGDNLQEIINFTGPHESLTRHLGDRWREWEDYESHVRISGLKIFTKEGPLMADVGDWILKGIQGECWPIKPDILALTYEEAPTPSVAEEVEALGRAAPMKRSAVCICGAVLNPVRQDGGSMLNADQFDSIKAGDWYCANSERHGGQPYIYFWDSDIERGWRREDEGVVREVNTLRAWFEQEVIECDSCSLRELPEPAFCAKHEELGVTLDELEIAYRALSGGREAEEGET